MNWDAIGAIGELVAAMAVIFSLVYVGMEIAQNNRNQRIAAMQSHYETNQGNLALLAEHAEAWLSGLENYPNLPPADNARFSMLIHAFFRHMEQAFLLNREGVLPDEAFENNISIMEGLFAYPSCQHWWSVRHENFNDDFRVKVEEIARIENGVQLYDLSGTHPTPGNRQQHEQE